MLDVREGQIWEFYQATSGSWRRARIINVLRERVELQFIDLPAVSDLTWNAARPEMRNRQRFRLVTGGASGLADRSDGGGRERSRPVAQ
jgi:hypothetical protein